MDEDQYYENNRIERLFEYQENIDLFERLKKENEQLKQQIEKMKCCDICRYSALNKDCEPCNSCVKFDEWILYELK